MKTFLLLNVGLHNVILISDEWSLFKMASEISAQQQIYQERVFYL